MLYYVDRKHLEVTSTHFSRGLLSQWKLGFPVVNL